MSHEKTTKEAIKDILIDGGVSGQDNLERTVNRIELLFQTMLRQVRLEVDYQKKKQQAFTIEGEKFYE
jgi:hypothetical protein